MHIFIDESGTFQPAPPARPRFCAVVALTIRSQLVPQFGERLKTLRAGWGPLQGARGLRVVRMLRLLRLVRAGAMAAIGLRLSRHLFGRRKFHYTAVVAVAVVLLGALGMFAVERGQNHAVSSFGDALWWSVVTATTVGYGDLSPVTTEGRFIAVLLMLTGIGVIGVFTATVASMFFENDRQDSAPDVHERLDHLERKLDAILDRLEVSARSTDGVVKRGEGLDEVMEAGQ